MRLKALAETGADDVYVQSRRPYAERLALVKSFLVAQDVMLAAVT